MPPTRGRPARASSVVSEGRETQVSRGELRRIVAVAALAACCPAMSRAADTPPSKTPERLPSIAAKTQAMRHMPGLLELHWDEKGGRLYLEIPHLGVELLYIELLPYGVGSN